MNIRPQLLACIFGITVLSGCAVDRLNRDINLVGLALTPIILPTVYAIQRSGIVQPVTVVSSSGEQLTPDFTDDAKEVFTVSEEAIVCNGFRFLEMNAGESSLVCNKELKVRAKITTELFYQKIVLSIGSESAPGAGNGSGGPLTEVTFTCSGHYDTTEGGVDPFLIDCDDDGKAAVSPVEGGKLSAKFKVWIHPPSIAGAMLQRMEQLKALAYQGDAKASYEYALRVNDSAEAWKFHCLAANQNHPDAQALVADHYRYGSDPVERDVLRAYVWFRLAELNGYEGRSASQQKPYSEVLADELTPSELADGERLVSEWKPNPAECEVAPKSPGS
jgi:hypothetical protein